MNKTEKAVRVEGHAIVYEPDRMEQGRAYFVVVKGRSHIVRKVDKNIVETYEVEPTTAA